MSEEDQSYLTGQCLIAMPALRDPRFARTVIYICAHNADGAMGLVLNRLIGSVTFPDLLSQLDIENLGHAGNQPIHFGGPVEQARGFVLHSDDYAKEETLKIGGGIALTATIDILRDLAAGGGPEDCLLALGYAGWGAGQLDEEIQRNDWLNVEPDEALLFGPDLDNKWERAFAKLGFDPSRISGEAGHA